MSRLLDASNTAVLLVAHGTVSELSDIPEFLKSVRRGRPASEALAKEMLHRYEAIGGSPLLKTTRAQATALESELGVPVRVAMRLWAPYVREVIPELYQDGVRHLIVLPLAPFSVDVYFQAALREAKTWAESQSIEVKSSGSEASDSDTLVLTPVSAWGQHDRFVDAHVALIQSTLAQGLQPDVLLLTAHSLPTRVIAMGDKYAEEVAACFDAVSAKLSHLPCRLVYQSQGADGGDWIGPELESTLRELSAEGHKHVAIAPFGFLADHVETLYDLDIEAKSWCDSCGLKLTRVPALNTRSDFIKALGAVARGE